MHLNELINYLKNNTSKIIFSGDKDKIYREYAQICHPDKNLDNVDLAKECFQLLDSKFKGLYNTTKIKSKKSSYEINEPAYSGDISSIYISEKHILKISRSPINNTLLEAEENILKIVRKNIEDKEYPYIPKLVDSFTITDNKKVNRRCNVFDDKPGISLAWLVENKKLNDARHIGWIFNRLLMSLHLSHSAGIIHGGILPTHFIIYPENHGGLLIDWTQSVEIGKIINIISPAYKSFYPREIFNKSLVSSETDIYMLGKVGLYLIGEQDDYSRYKLRCFMKGLCLENQLTRPDSVSSLYDEFQDLLLSLFGKPRFVELII